MVVVVSASIIAVVLSFVKFRGFKWSGLELGFIIVTVLGCIHYNYGNDYMAYYRVWHFVNDHSLLYCFSRLNTYDLAYIIEPVWIIINKVFGFTNGFFVMIAVINIVQNIIYYKFIKIFIEPRWKWLGLFLYLFTTSFYLLNFSMKRQGLAVALCVLAYSYIRNKKLWKAGLFIGLAASMHLSAIVFLISLIIVPFLEKSDDSVLARDTQQDDGHSRKDRYFRIIGILSMILTILLFVFPDIPRAILRVVTASGPLIEYSNYMEIKGMSANYGLGFVLKSVPYVVCLYFLLHPKYLMPHEKGLMFIYYISYLFSPFAAVGPALLARVGYYFSSYQIIAVPVMCSRIKSKFLAICLLIVVMFFAIYNYIDFFNDPIYKTSYSEFHTIFDVIF